MKPLPLKTDVVVKRASEEKVPEPPQEEKPEEKGEDKPETEDKGEA